MIRQPTDLLLMWQRSKWPDGLFEREESMDQVMLWVLVPLCSLLSLRARALTLTVPFPS